VAAGSEGIVVNLDPIAVGILEVDLFDIIGPELGGGAVLGPVAIFDMGLFQAFTEGLDGRDAEGEMYIDIMGPHFLSAGDHMQLAVVGYLEPDMFAIVEGLGYFLQSQDVLIKTGAFIQIYYIDGSMAQVDTL